MKRRSRVIVKFKDRKLRYQVMANRKQLIEKKNELKELHFEESLFLSDSMCIENHNLFYKCRQLKNTKRIHACWIFKNVVNWWIKAQFSRSFMNPIWENCWAPVSMIYWAIPHLNLKVVIVKLLTVVCVVFFVLFFSFFCLFLVFFSLEFKIDIGFTYFTHFTY